MLLLAIPMVTRAQYDVVFSHYADMQSSFNPAAIGKDPKLNINAAYALQMAGYTHNPNTAYISADIIKTKKITRIQFIRVTSKARQSKKEENMKTKAHRIFPRKDIRKSNPICMDWTKRIALRSSVLSIIKWASFLKEKPTEQPYQR